ncbi:hypothetical protein [Aquimarina algiphila]|uniref:hypothetical protein n=1 Tax=Aquimarina algiphila TaxID=2047982 RepID=UPI001430DCB7|nr:hypothetical protein [Aquimarina algiphila]
MLPDQINSIPPEILFDMLRELDMDIGEFMYQLLNDNPKAIMIYARIYIEYNTS